MTRLSSLLATALLAVQSMVPPTAATAPPAAPATAPPAAPATAPPAAPATAPPTAPATAPPAAQATAPPAARSAAAPATGNWPQWRGPGGLGVGQGTYPETWSASENVAWKTAIPGRGHSSPVVWGDRVYVTTSVVGQHYPGRLAPDHLGYDMQPGYLHPDSVDVDYAHALKVLALDAVSGAIVWERTAYDGPMYDNRHRKNTYASATVATDGEAVFASFESEGIYAYEIDGTPRWQASFGGMAKAGLGPGTSPILYDGLLILQGDQEMGTGSFIAALDAATGRVVWYTQRHNRRSWATPLLVEVDGHTELLASGAEAVIAYDPATGEELWRTAGTVSHPIPSIVAGNGLAFATAGSQRKVALAIRLGERTDEERIAWRYDKGTAYVPSPIFYRGLLYLMSDRGIVTALDGATGAVVYEGGRVPLPATFTASPVAFDGKILLTSEDGDTFVLRAGRSHEILRTNALGEPVFASPALANGTIYIRGAEHLYAVREGSRP